MAKRAPLDQKPFTALDKGLAASVMSPPSAVPPTESIEKQVEPATAVEIPERGTERPPVEAGGALPATTPVIAVEAPATLPRPSSTARRPVVTAKSTIEAPEKLSREKRVLLSPSEDREIERCVDRIAEGFGGTPVKLSHIIRACLTVVRHAETEVIRRAPEVGKLTRPPNGDAIALAEFEHELAKVLAQAFHDAPALR